MKPPEIRLATLVRAPRERVYDALTRAEELDAVVHEYGYPDTPEGWEQHMSCSTGWGEALTLLKFYVEHGVRY